METFEQQAPQHPIASTSLRAPRIGWTWAGGTYAGIIAGQNGQPDYHLIHAPAEAEMEAVNWAAAVKQATLPINGFVDWSLPNRREARLLAINTPAGFDVDGWYWTSEQYAGGPDYAWVQDFITGDQYYGRKSTECSARAVRRLLIIQ